MNYWNMITHIKIEQNATSWWSAVYLMTPVVVVAIVKFELLVIKVYYVNP